VRKLHISIWFLSIFVAPIFGQVLPSGYSRSESPKPPLDFKVQHFDVDDAILRDGLSELSQKNIDGLHLGFEEAIREKFEDDPREQNAHFSLHLSDKTVREILDTLCKSDGKYAWSADQSSINVYPRVSIDDPEYLLGLQIDQISLKNIPNPDQALPELLNKFPAHQVGYSQVGGDNSYPEPWTVSFSHLTVRQFINRISEHMGQRTSWIWRGGKDSRLFTFLPGLFKSR